MRVTCSISANDDSGVTIEACVEADESFVPEVIGDWLRHAGDHVLRMYEQTHTEAKP